MRKDHLNGKPVPQRDNNGQPCTPGNITPRTTTVIDRFPLYEDPESSSSSSPELSLEEANIKALRVLIKRSLPPQQPAPDLLVRIHQKIDAVRKEMDS